MREFERIRDNLPAVVLETMTQALGGQPDNLDQVRIVVDLLSATFSADPPKNAQQFRQHIAISKDSLESQMRQAPGLTQKDKESLRDVYARVCALIMQPVLNQSERLLSG